MNNRDVLFVQPIFCPNDAGFEVNKRSIKSIIDYFISNGEYKNIVFVFSGWVSDFRYYHEIAHILQDACLIEDFVCHLDMINDNYGKAKIVNEAVKKYRSIYNKYLFTCDSDIVFDKQEKNILNRLIDLSKNIKQPYGLISLAQKECDCQLHNEYNNHLKVFGEEIHWANHGGGIAGGCLFVNFDMWDVVEGYRVMGVYSGDDGWLLADSNHAGFFNCMVSTISIVHPVTEIKPGYNALKASFRDETDNTGRSYNKNFEKVQGFWNG